ncbi:YggS family pyridoxal phosphate-dependent enzyme [Candidatus Peregrinibacteria bacterium]|nr:YggS family pyridoxal phosphate-dependent enzyme [Candidatus Peregrinibacteria bacterium]
MPIAQNIQRIQEAIRHCSDKACLVTTVAPITIVAVTKGRTLEEINQALRSGIAIIGESRWQEASKKIHKLPSVEKHFIGHLQTNKVSSVVLAFDMIQSVDSLRLVKKIDEECSKIGKTMPILIEVNTSGEPQKTGADPGETVELIRTISGFKAIEIRGLMTLACDSDDPEKIRACFRRLRELSEKIKSEKIPNVIMETLSMGMTEDYKMAVEEGATMVRIGRGIFEDETMKL